MQDRRSKTEVMTEVSPSPFNRLGAQSSTGGKRMTSAKFDEALRECGATTPRRSRNISRTSSQASTEEEPALVRASKSAEGQVADVGTTSTDGQLIARRFVQAQVGKAEKTTLAVTSSTRDLLKDLMLQHSNDMHVIMTRIKGLEEHLSGVDGRLSGVEAAPVTSTASNRQQGGSDNQGQGHTSSSMRMST